jgi:hypothetical protein
MGLAASGIYSGVQAFTSPKVEQLVVSVTGLVAPADPSAATDAAPADPVPAADPTPAA